MKVDDELGECGSGSRELGEIGREEIGCGNSFESPDGNDGKKCDKW